MVTKETYKQRAEREEDLFRESPKRRNKRLKVTLPLPPSVNSMYVNTGRGGRSLSRTAKNYVRDSRALINEEIHQQRWVKQERNVWLYIDLVFFMPDRRVRDSHNMLKLLLDVMESIVYENDYFVMPRIQGVEYDKENPRVETLISVQTKSNRAKGFKIANSVV